jgi:cytoskeleton protein RodZ
MAQLDSVLQKPANTLAVTETKTASMPLASVLAHRAATVRWLSLVCCWLLLPHLLYFLLAKDLSSLRETAQTAIDSLARKADSEPPAPKAAELPAESAPIVPAVAPGEPVFPPGATPQQVMNPQVLVPPEQLAPATTPVVSGVTAEKSKPAAGEAQLRFVVDKESWVEVRDRDNKVVFSERFVQGLTKQSVVKAR